jgi:hypothetical protein
MVKTTISIDLPDGFRDKARQKFGDKRGSYTKALQEAVNLWVVTWKQN